MALPPDSWQNPAAWPGSAAQGAEAGTAPSLADPRTYQQFRTLRGRHLTLGSNQVGLTVPSGATAVTVTFVQPEWDVNYGVSATPNWLTEVWAGNKTVTGYTLFFGLAAPADATVDAVTFRDTTGVTLAGASTSGGGGGGAGGGLRFITVAQGAAITGAEFQPGTVITITGNATGVITLPAHAAGQGAWFNYTGTGTTTISALGLTLLPGTWTWIGDDGSAYHVLQAVDAAAEQALSGLKVFEGGAVMIGPFAQQCQQIINSSYAMLLGDVRVACTGLASAVTITLPPGGSSFLGSPVQTASVTIFDGDGSASASHVINVAPFSGHTINGSASTVAAINSAWGSAVFNLVGNTPGKWAYTP